MKYDELTEEKVRGVVRRVAFEMWLITLVLLIGVGGLYIVFDIAFPPIVLFCVAISISLGASGYCIRKALFELFLDDKSNRK